MKFQDDISNMNTYIHTYVHTYVHTDKPKPICPLLFQSWGHKKSGGGAVGESGWGVRSGGGMGGCEQRIEVIVCENAKKKSGWYITRTTL